MTKTLNPSPKLLKHAYIGTHSVLCVYAHRVTEAMMVPNRETIMKVKLASVGSLVFFTGVSTWRFMGS